MYMYAYVYMYVVVNSDAPFLLSWFASYKFILYVTVESLTLVYTSLNTVNIILCAPQSFDQ